MEWIDQEWNAFFYQVIARVRHYLSNMYPQKFYTEEANETAHTTRVYIINDQHIRVLKVIYFPARLWCGSLLAFILCDPILFLPAWRCGKSDIFIGSKTEWQYIVSHYKSSWRGIEKNNLLTLAWKKCKLDSFGLSSDLAINLDVRSALTIVCFNYRYPSFNHVFVCNLVILC